MQKAYGILIQFGLHSWRDWLSSVFFVCFFLAPQTGWLSKTNLRQFTSFTPHGFAPEMSVGLSSIAQLTEITCRWTPRSMDCWSLWKKKNNNNKKLALCLQTLWHTHTHRTETAVHVSVAVLCSFHKVCTLCLCRNFASRVPQTCSCKFRYTRLRTDRLPVEVLCTFEVYTCLCWNFASGVLETVPVTSDV